MNIRKRPVAILAVVLLAGLIGMYFLRTSNALNDVFNNVQINMNDIWAGQAQSVGTPFNVRINLTTGPSFTTNNSTQPGQVVVMLSTDRRAVKYEGLTLNCKKKYKCVSNATHNGTFPPEHHYVNAVVCVDLPSRPGSTTIEPFFTARFRAVRNINYVSVFWISVYSGIAPGSCQSNPDASGVVWGGGHGGCYHSSPSTIAPGALEGCDKGYGISIGPARQAIGVPDKTGGHEQGSGDDGKSQGAGGGGGSDASRQADKPNTIPSAGEQGDAEEQPELEPSPFFDGQIFAAGSDTDSLRGALTNTGRSVAQNWPWVLGGTITIGAVGTLAFWWWKRR